MQVDHERGRAGFAAQLDTFLGVLAALDEPDWWASSRCRGWCVMDVAVHVQLGLEEMLLGVVSPTAAEPDTDAATYWTGSPADADDPDQAAAQLHHLHFVRQLSTAHRTPAHLFAQLEKTAAGLRRGVEALPDGRVFFQERVLRTGDFLATWAVELAVHHLDLTRELELPAPAPGALALARQTIESLLGARLDLSDVRVVLLGTGRDAPTDPEQHLLAGLVPRLPVLG